MRRKSRLPVCLLLVCLLIVKSREQVQVIPNNEYDRPCISILPGINRMRNGVDITMLDLFPIDDSIQDGFRRPVVDFTCNERKMETFDRIIFDVPDQIWNFAPLPAGLLDGQVSTYENRNDIKRSYSRDLDGNGVSELGAFTGSGSFDHFQNYLADNKHVVEDVYGAVLASRATLLPVWTLKPSRHMQSYIDTFLPEGINNNLDAAKYEQFIQIFGTHFFSTAKFGGMIRMSIFTHSSLLQLFGKETVENAAKLVFKSNIENETNKNSLEFKENGPDIDDAFRMLNAASGKRVRYYGGHSAIGTTGISLVDVAVWEPTVHILPWLLGGNLIPVYNLVGNRYKQENLKLMTQVYMDKAELRMLHRLLSDKRRMQGDSHDIRPILHRIDTLMAQYLPKHEEVVEISTAVDIPSWFLRNTVLCQRWKMSKEVKSNCHQGGPSIRCAKIGHMTPFYIDQSNNGFGCSISWSVQSTEHAKWFNDVSLCFGWYGNNADECGGSRNGTICAKVNGFTADHLDKTYREGCGKKWKLVVPKPAPWWTRGLRLCIKWTPYDENSSNLYCGGFGQESIGGEFCAKINEWTNLYFDRTMKSDGKHRFCKLSWGIKMAP